MARPDAMVPDDSSVLCENCGYILDGLSTDGRCPECGHAIAPSTTQDQREPPAWEQPGRPLLSRFLVTTAQVIFQPSRFFRGMLTRRNLAASRRFAQAQWIIAAVLAGCISVIHMNWYDLIRYPRRDVPPAVWFVMAPAAYLFFWGVTELAARLSSWEARYRGLRLPTPVVLRSLHYHAAHYLPVALVALVIVGGHSLLLSKGVITHAADPAYLYTLCALVVLAAGYLFETYWIAMRKTMYANR